MSDSPKKSVPAPPPSEEFIQLFTRAQRSLYLFILSQVGRSHTAEEVLQETNLVLWAKYAQFDIHSNFMAWGRQVATYEILKYRQRMGREKLRFSENFMNVVADEVVAQSPELELRRDALHLCMKKLSGQDRELIEQRYQPGTSGKQLAKSLDRPANSVYQSLGRIRRALLTCIERQLSSLEVGT